MMDCITDYTVKKLADMVEYKYYLKATGLEVGLIINFGPSVEVKRMVL